MAGLLASLSVLLLLAQPMAVSGRPNARVPCLARGLRTWGPKRAWTESAQKRKNTNFTPPHLSAHPPRPLSCASALGATAGGCVRECASCGWATTASRPEPQDESLRDPSRAHT